MYTDVNVATEVNIVFKWLKGKLYVIYVLPQEKTLLWTQYGEQSNEKQETQTERYERETTVVCLLALRSMHDSPCPESQGLTSQNCIPQLLVPLVSSAVGFSQWMCSRLDGSRLDGRRIFLLRFL